MTVALNLDLSSGNQFSSGSHRDLLLKLQSDGPLHQGRDAAGRPYWIVTRHKDVTMVLGDDRRFRSSGGMRLEANPDSVAAVANHMLVVSDPPAQQRLRRVVGSAFTPPVVRRLHNVVYAVVRGLLAEFAADHGGDFVKRVARPLPTRVICDFMGLPRADWDWVGELTSDGLDSPDDDVRLTANTELFMYFSDLLESRNGSDGEDLISIVLSAAAAGPERQLSEVDIITNLFGILIGANETTRYAAAGGVIALSDNPQQASLLADPGTIATAVEEILRWTSPGLHAMRTVAEDTELHGHRLLPGDRIVAWISAANRDPRAFDVPEEFNVLRKPNRHVTFGYGSHFCVGARLARLELSALLDELRAMTMPRLSGKVTYSTSNFTWGPASLPMTM